jgi:hypothetical protein
MASASIRQFSGHLNNGVQLSPHGVEEIFESGAIREFGSTPLGCPDFLQSVKIGFKRVQGESQWERSKKANTGLSILF